MNGLTIYCISMVEQEQYVNTKCVNCASVVHLF